MEDEFINQLNEIIERSQNRELLLENIVKESDPIKNFPDSRNFLILARQWNSWYPSMLNVRGGCYLFNINKEIIIIDPGFNTLEIIKEKDLDLRLIKHIFITHFHPDHFENLIAIITRLTSKKNKILVYLNSTAYKQFKIYSRGFTEFIELKPGMNLKLDFESDQQNFEVNVSVLLAYHKEIGGAMNSINLKIILRTKTGTEYIIGFMSDTDGSKNYINYYLDNFNDCLILIPHLGAIHKEPKGYNHLYRSGLELLLQGLNSKEKYIFLGEFGFELATEQDFKDIVLDLIPTSKLNYNNLISIILTFFNDNTKVKKYPFVAQVLTSLFSFLINDVKILTPNLEILFPFIGYNEEFVSDSESIFYKDRAYELIKRETENFKKAYNSEQFIHLWQLFHKTIVFLGESSDNCFKAFEKVLNDWKLSSLFDNFKNNIRYFVQYLPRNLKLSLIRNFSIIASKYPVENNIMVDEIKNLVSVEVDEYSKFFLGLGNEIIAFFESEEMKGFIFIFFGYFMLTLFQHSSFTMPTLIEKDGREIICKYLSAKFSNKVIPVHPSYTILFYENEVKIRGYTDKYDCSHENVIALGEINKDWQILPKDEKRICKKEEYVSIVPQNKCIECIRIKEEKDIEWEREYARYEGLIESRNEEIIEEIENIDTKISGAEDNLDIFLIIQYLIFELPTEAVGGINQDLLLKKIKELFVDDKFLNLKILIHPTFLRFKEIKKYILERIIKIEDKLKDFFVHSLKDSFPYKMLEEEEVSSSYYELYDDLDLIDIFENKINDLNMEEIFKIINFFITKRIKDKNFSHRKSYFYFKKQFVKVFFPLVEDPRNHLEEYRLIKRNKRKIDNINQLGYPFLNYNIRLKRNLYILNKEGLL